MQEHQAILDWVIEEYGFAKNNNWQRFYALKDYGLDLSWQTNPNVEPSNLYLCVFYWTYEPKIYISLGSKSIVQSMPESIDLADPELRWGEPPGPDPAPRRLSHDARSPGLEYRVLRWGASRCGGLLRRDIGNRSGENTKDLRLDEAGD